MKVKPSVGHSVSFVDGVSRSDNILSNGYFYNEGHIDSFCWLLDAVAIRFCDGESICWKSCDIKVDREVDRGQVDSDLPTVHPEGYVFAWEFAMGNGAAYPQPAGFFELSVGGDVAIGFSLKKQSHLYSCKCGAKLYLDVVRKKVATGGSCFTLDEFVKDESTYVEGISYLYLPAHLVAGKKNIEFKISAKNYDGQSRRWYRLGRAFNVGNLIEDSAVETLLRCEESLHKTNHKIGTKNVYFGDIHIHTSQTQSLHGDGCGTGSVEQNLRYARDVAGLDFCAITDHDWQLDDADWKNVRCANDKFNKDGSFVTLHAYEWTSANYGHRNVYFKDDKLPDDLAPFDFQKLPHKPVKFGISSKDDPTPDDLHNWLDSLSVPAMTIPHHPNVEQFPMDFFEFFNDKYDRCVEVYSNWGCFLGGADDLNMCCARKQELDYCRYAGKLHFGFLASSDGHDGNAGESNVTKSMKQMSHFAGSGRVAVLADELCRASIFDAIYLRHCYATTGARILLDFRINDSIIGDIIDVTQSCLNASINVECPDNIENVCVFKNAELIKRFDLDEIQAFATTFKLDPAPASYYVQVKQTDEEYAWSSPIFYNPV